MYLKEESKIEPLVQPQNSPNIKQFTFDGRKRKSAVISQRTTSQDNDIEHLIESDDSEFKKAMKTLVDYARDQTPERRRFN